MQILRKIYLILKMPYNKWKLKRLLNTEYNFICDNCNNIHKQKHIDLINNKYNYLFCPICNYILLDLRRVKN